jgi:hypothetical protein
MTTVAQNCLTTGDYPLTSGGYYTNHYCTYWPCPICNPPIYYTQPVYVPGTIIINNDYELKEEVKGLKEEIKKLRKELTKK